VRKCLHILACLALFLSACGGENPTAIAVEIFADSTLEILVPEDINQLKISVEANEAVVWGPEVFVLQAYSPPKPLEESITFRPGKAADETIRVIVVGMKDEVELLSGEADARFISTKIQHANVALKCLQTVCIDKDGDNHGKCPACLGTDCDETNPAVNSSAREECNDVDDDCNGTTDDISEVDRPRCEHFRGVCKLARQNCVEGAWDNCDTGYGEDYEQPESSCDLLDNDCDGAIDEGCSCILGGQQECDAPNRGECVAGTQTCDPVTPTEGEWGDACVGAIPPVAEQCNLLDDDCDGITDEDFDKLNDNSHCGQCNNVCAAGMRCYNGDCLPECPLGFFPATTGGVPVCISTLQEAATPCQAFGNCADLTEGGMVGYGSDGWTLPVPLPADFYLENPIIVWSEITGEIGDLSARYVCLDETPEAKLGGGKACPNCSTTCDTCVPEDCQTSSSECAKCGCALRYWCYTNEQ
jgi:hypothetical protein